ncbi:MAG: MATE family efflux transporter [Clostridiaceae bacterium]|jgi:putative MATE family efflux protein|nr:MATE family efflux transporter [Clostridiaceae bacterium]
MHYEMEQLTKTKNLDRTIILLVYPVFLELFLQTIIGYIDVIMIGRLGTQELAAIQVCNSPIDTIITIFTAFGIGCTALLTRYAGAEDKENINRCIGQTILISIAVSFITFIIFNFFRYQVLILMGAAEDIIDSADTYMKYVSYSIPGLIFCTMMYGLIRGMGNTKVPMYINIIQNIMHLFLNFFLIYDTRSVSILNKWEINIPGLNMGIKGAAISTLISRNWCVIGLLVYYAIIKKIKLSGKYLKFDKGMMKSIIIVGLPASLEQLIFKGGMLGFTRIVVSLGSISLAAHAVAETAEMISYLPGLAFEIVTLTLAGQFLGAGMLETAELSAKKTDRLARIFMGSFGLLFIIIPGIFVKLFTTDKEVIQLASTVLRIEGFSQVFLARFYVYGGFLRGTGNTKDVLITSFIGVWTVRLVACAIAVYLFNAGLVGAWIAMFLDLFIRAIIITSKIKSENWKRQVIASKISLQNCESNHIYHD